MCKALHLAAEMELPLVAWDEHQRGFNVNVPDFGFAKVKHHFTQPYIVYAGAHTGCSCGFCWDEGGLPVEMLQHVEEDKACTKDLLLYAAEALKTCQVVEAYGCWEGDWALPNLGQQTISVSAVLAQEIFYLPEMVRIRFVK